jgi:transcriptional regulator with XRE-family HTH domain
MYTSDFTWSEVGRRIQVLRLARGLKQIDLATAAGLTNAAISILEGGKTSPRLSTLQKVASALSCSVRYLVCGEPGAEPSAHEEALTRIHAILTSRDADATRTFWNGVAICETMIRRRSIALCFRYRFVRKRDESVLPSSAERSADKEVLPPMTGFCRTRTDPV